MLHYSATTVKDVVWMAKHCRPEDKREIETATGHTATRALAKAVTISTFTCTARHPDSDDPLFLFGVAPSQTQGFGVIWMVGSPAITGARYRIAADAPRILRILSNPYPNGLHCLADARNTLHIRWLKRFGFTEAGQRDLNGFPFLHLTYPT